MLVNVLIVLLNIVLLILVLAVVAFMLILISPIRIRVHFVRRKDKDSFSLTVRAPLGIYTYKFEIPDIEYENMLDKGLTRLAQSIRKKKTASAAVTEAVADPIEDTIGFDLAVGRFRELRKNAKGLNKGIKHLMKKMHCTELRWLTGIGLGDAPLTAVATGAGWAFKTTFLGYLFRYIRLNTRPNLAVQPLYNRYFFSMEVTAAVRIRAGSLLVSMIGFFFRLKDKKWLLRQLLAERRKKKARSAVAAGNP
ncbi:DUF2953 domain-containing protein [Gorillibacterium massiliense]|uniref:DUF2953 domain-containing protein n=1 Tax=Gorillibacterium massiliense TaxID=1280390 RepID=UPI0004B047DB|nr:DUF2953 domain-containing protein [Gorillibacterium massiliense]